MQQRYYDPVAGRFLSIDPVETDSNSGTSFNRYAYANNNPYRFIDRDGRCPVEKDGVACTASLVLIPTRPCGISYLTDARLPHNVAFPVTSASAARFIKAAHIKAILVVGCEKA